MRDAALPSSRSETREIVQPSAPTVTATRSARNARRRAGLPFLAGGESPGVAGDDAAMTQTVAPSAKGK